MNQSYSVSAGRAIQTPQFELRTNSGLPQAIDNARKMAEELRAMCDQLGTRLGPILRSQSEVDGKPGCSPPSTCAAESSVSDLQNAIGECRSIVQSINDRLWL